MCIYNKKTKKELVKIILRRDKKLKKKDSTIEFLEGKICKLEKRLAAYENAHTPPSKRLFQKKVRKKEKGKIGAKKGHPKYTRKEPIPDKTIIHAAVDEKDKDRKLIFYGMRTVYEEEIPEPRPVKVIEHVIYQYLDLETNEIIDAKNNAPKSSFGKNVHAHVTLLRIEDRLPLRKVTSSLLRHYGIEITNPGIYGITKRVAKKLNPTYYDIIKKIRSAKVIYADETKFKLNGQTWWLWVFVCEDVVLFVIRKSRGKKVIKEVLGKEFNGKIVADGWKVYREITRILQRCWAHLLRECDELKDKHNDFKNWNELIHKLFKEIQKIREKPPPLEKRIILQQKMRDRLESIGRNMMRNHRFRKLGKKIINGLDAWFTCVVHIEVEPTNNFAEQKIRVLVILRKIMGGLRSVDGAMILERLATCIETWKKQEKPLFQTLKNHL